MSEISGLLDREITACPTCNAPRGQWCLGTRRGYLHKARKEYINEVRRATQQGQPDPFRMAANRIRALSGMKPHLIRPADAPDASTHGFVIDEARMRAVTAGVSDRYVYFIRNQAGLIKVGFSSDVPRRFRTLITSAGQMMEFLGAFPGGPEVESEIHFEFASDRVIGEWFRSSDDLLEYLQLRMAEHRTS